MSSVFNFAILADFQLSPYLEVNKAKSAECEILLQTAVFLPEFEVTLDQPLKLNEVQMWLKSFFGSFVILFIIGILVFFSPDLQKLFGPGKSVDENNVSKLIDSLMNAPEIHLNYEDSYSKTQKNCLYHTCFDVYKCGGLHKKILVHISKPQRIFEGKIISPTLISFTF